jgi:hypothetical protein
MAYFLFVDESGQDHRESPYEVLAGVAVEDRDLWNLIVALRGAETRCFGQRYTHGRSELKAKKLLKTKVFRHAAAAPALEPEERCRLARHCLDEGAGATPLELAALAQAKLAFVDEALELCARYRCKVFASIVHPQAPQPAAREHLRKDYSYLLERFFYFLEDTDPGASGIVVFDELERVQSHILVDQMSRYFAETHTGRLRAGRIIPEPFFVHSELTTGVQLADLVAYIISWGFRLPQMTAPARPEIAALAERLKQMRYRAVRERMGNPAFEIWSFAWIKDLRAREELGEG